MQLVLNMCTIFFFEIDKSKESFPHNRIITSVFDITNLSCIFNIFFVLGFEIGLEGTFQLGEMVKARPVIIDGYLCRMNGSILDPIVGRVIRDDIYVRDISTTDKITSNPLLKDPLEDIYVEVQKSTIPSAGEGLFLKKDAKVKIFSLTSKKMYF